MGDVSSVCVFLASSTGSNPANAAATVALAEAMVERDLTVVYGGGAVGLMGLLADTVLAAGGRVIGIIPTNLFSREVAHTGLTQLIETNGMHERKALMAEHSDAFIALPGGLGTLEELAEVATWRQIGIHDKPLGLVDVEGYYSGLLQWMDRVVGDGLLSSQNRGMVHAAADPLDVLDLVMSDDQTTTSKWDA